jgi:hypothetical protein
METIYIKIGLAVIFILAAIGKLTGKTKSTFEKAGYSREAMYATAIAEIVLTIVLFTKYELLATLGLLAVIGGALSTLLRQRAKPPKYTMASVAAIMLCVLLYSFLAT